MRYAAIVALPLLLGGCAGFLPPAVQYASWALDAVSYVGTGKSVNDHALSMLTKEDCALLRFVQGESVCREDDGIEERAPYQIVLEAFKDRRLAVGHYGWRRVASLNDGSGTLASVPRDQARGLNWPRTDYPDDVAWREAQPASAREPETTGGLQEQRPPAAPRLMLTGLEGFDRPEVFHSAARVAGPDASPMMVSVELD